MCDIPRYELCQVRVSFFNNYTHDVRIIRLADVNAAIIPKHICILMTMEFCRK